MLEDPSYHKEAEGEEGTVGWNSVFASIFQLANNIRVTLIAVTVGF